MGRYLLAVLQSFGVATFVYQQGVVVTSSLEFHISTVVCLDYRYYVSDVVRGANYRAWYW